MILDQPTIDLIRARRKTMVRYPIKPGETTCPYQPGRVYKAQANHRQRGQLQLTVLTAQQERLGEITPRDARREGYVFVLQFMRAFEETHGTSDPSTPVWAITFKVGDHRDLFDNPRFLVSIGHVGQVTYESEPVPGKHPRHRWPHNDDHSEDYTNRADLSMIGEPEAVTPAELDRFARDAKQNDTVRRLLPAHGSLARISQEIDAIRNGLATNGRIDRTLHRDLVRLERARDALTRRLAS